jgi:ComEC/Rec2-related protein
MFSNPNNSSANNVAEYQNLWFWLPILFACGQIIFITYQNWFSNHYQQYLYYFIANVIITIFLCFFYYKINRPLFFCCVFVAFFLLGIGYCKFYHYRFLSYQKLNGFAFTNISGTVSAIKSSNNSNKINVIIANPIIKPYIYSQKNHQIKKKKQAKKHIKKNKKIRKNIKKTSKKSSNKTTNKYPFTEKNIFNNFINVKNYQDIDREFLDKNKKIANLIWNDCQSASCKTLVNPPPFISINLVSQNLAVNDQIAVNAMFNASSHPDLLNSFEWQKHDLTKKIGGYAIAIGETTITNKAKINNFQQYILDIREKINHKIKNNINNPNISAVASALLIGNQEQISENILQNIRNSGLSHLLSISGFHLGLVAMMFFSLSRYVFASNQFIAINYNIKKISAVFAILTSYIYLHLASSPLPAQRAFIVVAVVMLSYVINEKFHPKRAIFLAFFLLILFNPYALYNLGFQLSFLAIAVLGFYYSNLKPLIFQPNIIKINNSNTNLWQAFYRLFNVFWQYFIDIVIISLLITIFSLPIIMNSVQNFAVLGFLANIFAIPLTSFVIMPLGVISLILMPFNLEKIILIAMTKSIEIFLSIASAVSNAKINNIDIAFINTPYLPSLGLLISLFGFLLFIIHQHKYLKIIAIVIFFAAISMVFWHKNADLIFLHNQKLVLFYQQKSQQLFFFGKFNNTKQKQNILQKFNTKQATILPQCYQNHQATADICWQHCNKNNCLFRFQNFTILLLKKTRHHLPTLCQIINQYKINLMVNFSKKYALPSSNYCQINHNFSQIDNLDFLIKGTHAIFLDDT